MMESGHVPTRMVARTQAELAELMSRLHDSFFDLPDATSSLVGTICFTGFDDCRPVRQPIRSRGPFMKFDVSYAIVDLIVHGIVSVKVDDQARIGGFNLNEGHYSEARSELTITSGEPVTLVLRVRELHVEAAFRNELRHRRTSWGFRRRRVNQAVTAPPAAPRE